MRYGIAGTGNIAHYMALSMGESDRVCAVAVGSRSADRARRFAEAHGIARSHGSYADLIADPAVDAVYVALENHLHAEVTLAALAAGKPVLCEKPLATSRAEAETMVNAAAAAGLPLGEAFAYRHTPVTRAAAALVASGALGTPRLIRAAMTYHRHRQTAAADNSAYRDDPRRGGGALLDSGCYAISLAQLIFGRRARAGFAHGDVRPEGADETVLAILDYGDRQRLQLACSTALPVDETATIQCDEGIVVMPISNWSDRSPTIQVKRGAAREIAFETLECPPGDGYRLEAEAFARTVAGDHRAFAMSSTDSLDGMAALDALRASLASGGWASLA